MLKNRSSAQQITLVMGLLRVKGNLDRKNTENRFYLNLMIGYSPSCFLSLCYSILNQHLSKHTKNIVIDQKMNELILIFDYSCLAGNY